LINFNKWVIHHNVANTIDALLATKEHCIETRWKEEDGFRVMFERKNVNSASISWFESLKKTVLEDFGTFE